jgi:hypothetical protein
LGPKLKIKNLTPTNNFKGVKLNSTKKTNSVLISYVNFVLLADLKIAANSWTMAVINDYASK